MGFKENLKIRRLELNLTLEEVSKKLSVKTQLYKGMKVV